MDFRVGQTLMVAAVVVVVPVVAFGAFFMFWPGALIKAYNWYVRRRLGLLVRYSYSGSYRFCYSSRGTPQGPTPSLLLLHGFSASKDMWLPVVKHLPRDQHVVCVDMPGHEGTCRTGANDYSIKGQVARIHQFVQSIGLDRRPFHLVGTSMGGNVAGVYAATYPSSLCSITLMCPAGLIYPKDSEFVSRLKELEKTQQEDSIPLIPSSLPQLEDMLRLCCHNPLNLPRQVLKGLLDNRMPNNGFYKELFMEIVEEKSRLALQEHMHLITSPLQIIWGREDRVLDVSGAAVLQAAVPGSRLELLEHCGHSVSLERPRKAANLIMDFIAAQGFNTGEAKKRS
ncbi:monoacylglycerol lipase abhd6-A-like [Betta splendens]|uniref:Monoacylglycerol lipase abhd6-A-like n=1 Tax=Betta splendens TaxID=158456 RepID=A0A6P7MKT5_BETSP|nr:monoacylglycerol lipase abhd6-A-like [Betta splendens]